MVAVAERRPPTAGARHGVEAVVELDGDRVGVDRLDGVVVGLRSRAGKGWGDRSLERGGLFLDVRSGTMSR